MHRARRTGSFAAYHYDNIVVRHPKQVFLAENKTTAIIDVTERIHIVDVDQISAVAIRRRGATSAKS
jgi:hypothetical protein